MQQSFILAVFLVASASASSLFRREDETRTCQEYDARDPTKATCNKRPDIVCSKGCTGGVVAQNCTPVSSDTGSGDQKASTPLPSVTCTKSFGASSATSYTCISDKGSFDCTGPSTGSATCSGCAKNGVQIGNVSATTPGTANTTSPGVANNMTSGAANATTMESPSSGTPPPTPKSAGNASSGNSSSSSGSGGSGSPNGAPLLASGSIVSACLGALAAGVASIVV